MKKPRYAELRRFALCSLGVSIVFFPVYIMLIAGLMSEKELHRRPPYLFPPSPTLRYYEEAAKTIAPYLKNSFIIAAGNVLITLLLAPPVGFGLAKLRIRYKSLISAPIFLLQMLPEIAVLTPLFLIWYKLGLTNTQIGVIIGFAAFQIPFSSLVLAVYMRSIPDELLESAHLDGASLFCLYRTIALPLSKPALATTGLLAFITGWGNLIVPLTFLQSKQLLPASVGMTTFVSSYGVQWNLLMAASALYAIGPMIIAFFAGRQLAAGLMAGALKE